MRIGIILIFLGFFLLRSQLENIVTEFIPGSMEIPIGIGLILYGYYRLKNK